MKVKLRRFLVPFMPLLVGAMAYSIPSAAVAASAGGANVRLEVPSKTKQTTGGLCPAQLNSAIGQVLNRSSGVRWGILVQTQAANSANRKTLFARNADQLLIPASNNKILTMAAALKQLGAQYRIRTAVYGDSTGPNLSTLRIIGHGDPSLTTAQLNALAQQLSQKGIRQVAQLIGDDTYFRGPVINPNWEAEDTLTGYGAAVNGLILNQNAINFTLFPQRTGQPLRVQWDDPSDAADWILSNQSVTTSPGGSEYVDAVRTAGGRVIEISGQLRAGSESETVAVSAPNPGNYLVAKLRSALNKAGIAVGQSTLVRATPAPPGEVELAAVESAPFSQLLFETNQESNNLFAEAFLKTLGRLQNPNSLDATASGVAAVKAILTPLGVNPNRYSMVDGSGLAVRNRVSPEALVQTLQAVAQLPEADVFRRSLPVAGVSGTLKNRFRNTPAQGILLAKTGTISGVVSLSGYLTPPNYSPIVLSIIANYSNGSTATVRSLTDQVVLVLTRLRPC